MRKGSLNAWAATLKIDRYWAALRARPLDPTGFVVKQNWIDTLSQFAPPSPETYVYTSTEIGADRRRTPARRYDLRLSNPVQR